MPASSTPATAPATRSTPATGPPASRHPATTASAGPGDCPRGGGRALRFRTPDEGITVVHDVIRGPVEFPCAAMDDFVIAKADGSPLFVLANVVDDIDMAISHVIRGEDLLPTTPRGVLVWEALRSIGWRTDGSVARRSLGHPGPALLRPPAPAGQRAAEEAVQAAGPGGRRVLPRPGLPARGLPQLSGPARVEPPGGQEIFDTGQMQAWFRLEDVNRSPAFFDVAKLTHMNGKYIRAMPTDAFIEACRPWLSGESAPWPDESFDAEVFARMAPVVQERVAVLGEVPSMVDFLFLDRPDIDEEAWAKAVTKDSDSAVDVLARAIEAYTDLSDGWDRDALHEATAALAERMGRSLSKAQAPIRRGRDRPTGGPAPLRVPRGTGSGPDARPSAPGPRPGRWKLMVVTPMPAARPEVR